jgi:hypothetical protein
VRETGIGRGTTTIAYQRRKNHRSSQQLGLLRSRFQALRPRRKPVTVAFYCRGQRAAGVMSESDRVRYSLVAGRSMSGRLDAGYR